MYLNHFSPIIAFLFPFLLSYTVSCGKPSIEQTQEATLDEMIGQMIMVGFRGLEVSSDSVVAQEIKSGKVGGVILFSRDALLGSPVRNIESPEQVKRLISNLKAFSSQPLFVAVDQEGGLVARLSPAYGFPPTVSAQYLGGWNHPDTTSFYAERMAATLAEMGFNMNFAPIADVNTNPASPAIGALKRSFSADTNIVTEQCRIFIRAHREKNIFCSLKHFPGHGSAGADSHLGFTDVSESWDPLELAPYRELIKSGDAELIMTAHIFNDKWDAAHPATLSINVMTKMLREQLGYQGVIVSDDMNMKAISAHYNERDAYKMAIEAGVDILLVANNLSYDLNAGSKAHAIVRSLVEEGIISEDRIRASYLRIMKLKERL